MPRVSFAPSVWRGRVRHPQCDTRKGVVSRAGSVERAVPATNMRLLAILLLVCGSAIGQNGPGEPPVRDLIPVFDVHFSTDSAVSVPLLADYGFGVVRQCGAHGLPYIWLLSQNGMEVAGFTADGIATFETSKMTDVPEPRTGKFFVSESGVYVLVTGLENARKETVTETDENGKVLGHRTQTTGEPHQYIARFGTDGSYKGAIELDLPFKAYQIAAFESGNFLIAGLDGQKQPRVAAVNSSGQLQTFVELDKDASGRPKSAQAAFKKSLGDDASMDVVAMFAQFVPYHGNVLLVRSRTSTPIYEIRDGGDARAVKVKAPNGFVVDGMIPSDKGEWLVEFFKPVAGGSLTEGERAVYSVDPESGKLLNQYRFKDKDVYVACGYQDGFFGFRQQEKRLSMLRGKAEPAQPAATGEVQ